MNVFGELLRGTIILSCEYAQNEVIRVQSKLKKYRFIVYVIISQK
jgi:hypothetical protein